MDKNINYWTWYGYMNLEQLKSWLEENRVDYTNILNKITITEKYNIDEILEITFQSLFDTPYSYSNDPWIEIFSEKLYLYNKLPFQQHYSLLNGNAFETWVTDLEKDKICNNHENYYLDSDLNPTMSPFAKEKMDYLNEYGPTEKILSDYKKDYIDNIPYALGEYYTRWYSIYIKDFSFWTLDSFFWIKLLLRMQTNESVQFDYAEQIQKYINRDNELKKEYNLIKKKMKGIPLYDYIQESMKVNTKDKRDFVSLNNFCPELQIYIYFNPSIQQLFLNNSESYNKCFFLKTVKENVNRLGSLLNISMDKDISYYICEALFGYNICLCLTYYEIKLREMELFEFIEREYDKISSRLMCVPTICTRTLLIEEFIEPLLLINYTEITLFKDHIKNLLKLSRKILHSNDLIMRVLINTFFVVESESDLSEKISYLNHTKEESDKMIIDFNLRSSGGANNKNWESLIFRKETYHLDDPVFTETNKIFIKYQRKYNKLVKNALYIKNKKSQ